MKCKHRSHSLHSDVSNDNRNRTGTEGNIGSKIKRDTYLCKPVHDREFPQ